MRQVAVPALAALVLAGLMGGVQAADPIPLKMAAPQAPTDANCIVTNHLKELLEEKAPGRFDAQVICGFTLGSDVELARQVRAGLVQFASNSSANLSVIDPGFGILDLPFMFDNAEQAAKVLSGPFAQELLDRLENYGLKGLVFNNQGFRQIFNSRHPINEFADLEGLKLRSTQSAIDLAAIKALGANPTPMPYGEVYAALQTEVVEGILLPTTMGYSMRFQEVAPNLAILDLQLVTFAWITNKAWFDGLPPDLQTIFVEAVQEAHEFSDKEVARQQEEVSGLLEKEGLKVTVISEEAKAPMIEAAVKEWEQFKGPEGPIPAEFYERIEKAKAAAE